jgi:hypothetical protein
MENERSLLKCTLKKSWNVFVKWIIGSIIILAAISAIFLAYVFVLHCGVWIYENIILNPVGTMCNAIVWIINIIPWPVWAVLGIIGAIIGYSYSWCIAQELTEEDWQSSESRSIADISLIVVIIVGLALIILLIRESIPFVTVIVVVLGFVLITLFASLATRPAAIRFLGAYMHYHKRIK